MEIIYIEFFRFVAWHCALQNILKNYLRVYLVDTL
jgi:hypothetical protein